MTESKVGLEQRLRALDRDKLVALFMKRIRIDEGFVSWLEWELAAMPPEAAGAQRVAIDPKAIAGQVRAAFSEGTSQRRGRYDYHNEAEPDEAAIAALIENAKSFLAAGDIRTALAIVAPIADALVPAYIERMSWDETLHAFFPIIGQFVAEAVLTQDLTPDERNDLAARLDGWRGELEDYEISEYFQVAMDALEQGWAAPGLADALAGRSERWPMESKEKWTEDLLAEARLRVLDRSGRHDEYLNLARAVGRHGDHAAMLLRLGRAADAVGYAREKFRSGDEVLQLSRLLNEAGETEAALALAEWGLAMKSETGWVERVSLAQWLRDIAANLGRHELARMAAAAAFERSLSIEDFRHAKIVAQQDWEQLRPRLLEKLTKAKYSYDRTEIFLEEGLIDEAVRSVTVRNHLQDPSNHVLLRLAEAAHASHPDWVIDLCERMAENIMETGQAGFYELAAQWLERAARAYDAADRFELWMTRLDRLIEKHKRKYKLRPLLEALRTGG